jgi:hypothetical protein
MRTFIVYGCGGELTVSASSGHVLEYDDMGYGDNEYAAIVFVNVDEWRNSHPGDVPDRIDILDLGYWTDTGEYEPPKNDWRRLMASE